MSDDTTAGNAQERADLRDELAKHRNFLLKTTDGLTEEQGRARPTASELCIGGLIKHLVSVEHRWQLFMDGGAEAMRGEPIDWAGQFVLQDDESMAQSLENLAEVARRTEQMIMTVDLDQAHELPSSPWNKPGTTWTNRRVILHLLSEMSQHAGHADIIRETIDGQKTMG